MADNREIGARCGASPEWIVERTGIVTRRYADDGVTTAALGSAAVRDLLRRTTEHSERTSVPSS
ncbi:hypothetical protein [Streptomyces fuscichromogenes]|uniref:Uncharacterized protein n=1 Tax=Streptomyces fuscichromogenes TaxID=1324013 RepID=A0A917XQF5_9ACTN|nr:hypothetical protein [Streptomyces fuscichromogenes]GGN45441.1 hypothetical protein GCM10011578_097370 [Streptomyces fuscichromogenes]